MGLKKSVRIYSWIYNSDESCTARAWSQNSSALREIDEIHTSVTDQFLIGTPCFPRLQKRDFFSKLDVQRNPMTLRPGKKLKINLLTPVAVLHPKQGSTKIGKSKNPKIEKSKNRKIKKSKNRKM